MAESSLPALLAELRSAVPRHARASRGRGGRESGGHLVVYHDDDHAIRPSGARAFRLSRAGSDARISTGWRAKGCFSARRSSKTPDLGAFAGDPADRREQPTSGQPASATALWSSAWCIPRTARARSLLRRSSGKWHLSVEPRASIILRPAVGSGGVLQSGDAHARKPAAWFTYGREGYATDIHYRTTLWRGSTRAGRRTALSD